MRSPHRLRAGKEVGLTAQESGELRCQLPVVPLFETYEDLEIAPAVTDAFLPPLYPP